MLKLEKIAFEDSEIVFSNIGILRDFETLEKSWVKCD